MLLLVYSVCSCTCNIANVIISRGVPIIGSAKIMATNMAFFYQYRYRHRTVRGLISLPIFIQYVAIPVLHAYTHHMTSYLEAV